VAEVRDLAYSIVTTILHRLYRKGLAARQPSGAATPTAWPKTGPYTAQAMLALLGRGHDRDAVLARFLTILVTRT
jgi:predicted transcriptional regulator